jgi:myosin-1
MISTSTWPNYHGGSAQEGVKLLVEEQGLAAGTDIVYGRTKLFVRHPKTLLDLESARSRMIPVLCLILQRVCCYH